MTVLPILIFVPLALAFLQYMGVFTLGDFPGAGMKHFWTIIQVLIFAIFAVAVKERIQRMGQAYYTLFATGAASFYAVSLYLDSARMKPLLGVLAGTLLAVCAGAFWRVCELALERVRGVRRHYVADQMGGSSPPGEIGIYVTREYQESGPRASTSPLSSERDAKRRMPSAPALAASSLAGAAVAAYALPHSVMGGQDSDPAPAYVPMPEIETPMVNVDGTPMFPGTYVDVNGRTYGDASGVIGTSALSSYDFDDSRSGSYGGDSYGSASYDAGGWGSAGGGGFDSGAGGGFGWD